MSQSVKMFFGTLHLGKLEIPAKFVRLYGETFLTGTSIILTAPNGDTWPVALEKNEGSVTIGKGWTEFAHHYSMGAMDFIVFKYKSHQKSLPVFNVIILKDSTNMEIIHYPSKHHHPSNRQIAPASFVQRQSIYKGGRCFMGMPLEFLRQSGLINKTTLLLKGESGIEWEVKLGYRVQVCHAKSKNRRVQHTRYHLGSGWSDFRKNNDIANTDNLKFQHVRGCLIAVTKVHLT